MESKQVARRFVIYMWMMVPIVSALVAGLIADSLVAAGVAGLIGMGAAAFARGSRSRRLSDRLAPNVPFDAEAFDD